MSKFATCHSWDEEWYDVELTSDAYKLLILLRLLDIINYKQFTSMFHGHIRLIQRKRCEHK